MSIESNIFTTRDLNLPWFNFSRRKANPAEVQKKRNERSERKTKKPVEVYRGGDGRIKRDGGGNQNKGHSKRAPSKT